MRCPRLRLYTKLNNTLYQTQSQTLTLHLLTHWKESTPHTPTHPPHSPHTHTHTPTHNPITNCKMRVNLSSYETLTYKNNWPDTPQNFQRTTMRGTFCFVFVFVYLFKCYVCLFVFLCQICVFWHESYNSGKKYSIWHTEWPPFWGAYTHTKIQF